MKTDPFVYHHDIKSKETIKNEFIVAIVIFHNLSPHLRQLGFWGRRGHCRNWQAWQAWDSIYWLFQLAFHDLKSIYRGLMLQCCTMMQPDGTRRNHPRPVTVPSGPGPGLMTLP